MSFISKILSGSAGELIKTVGGVVDQFTTSKEEKLEFMVKFEELLQKRDSEIEQTARAELEAKSNIITAELNQTDNYTKRARPTVVYFGLFAIFFNYMFIPAIQSLTGTVVSPFDLPTEFWVAWGGVVGVYSMGRSMEKSGTVNRGTQLMTGSNTIASKLLE